MIYLSLTIQIYMAVVKNRTCFATGPRARKMIFFRLGACEACHITDMNQYFRCNH